MTKHEANIKLAAVLLADNTEFDLPRWVVVAHAEAAIRNYIYGLSLSRDFATSGSIIGENTFDYPEPRAV